MTDVTEFADARTFLALLPFVRELGINVVAAAPGAVIVEMPYAEQFSTPPNHFPASFVGVLGDVAAASSCISRLPKGWAGATLDYTVKMTGRAQGGEIAGAGACVASGANNICGCC